MNEWEAIARRGALEAFLEGDEEPALDLLAAARAMSDVEGEIGVTATSAKDSEA